jgi:hypothetical protein
MQEGNRHIPNKKPHSAGGAMRRREFVTLIAGVAVAQPFTTLAQEPGRTYHIAVLNTNPRGSPVVTALFDELRRNGLVEGRNLVVEWTRDRGSLPAVCGC